MRTVVENLPQLPQLVFFSFPNDVVDWSGRRLPQEAVQD